MILLKNHVKPLTFVSTRIVYFVKECAVICLYVCIKKSRETL